MSFTYHPFGPCVPSVGTGAANAQEPLGVAENGGTVTLEFYDGAILSDAGGPRSPVELQTFLAAAYVDVPLTTWDQAILNKLIQAAEASSTPGVAGVPGALLGTGGYLKSLYLPSSLDLPWTFGFAKLEPLRKKEGTQYEAMHLRFKAIRWLAGSVSTGAGAILFTRAAPP